MSSILTSIFKATISLLIGKGRDKVAEKLKEGDVTDQKFRSLIVREMDDIKSKLDGISRKDLLASASFFEEGIEILYDVFRSTTAMSYSTQTDVPPQAGASSTSEEMALALTQRNRELDLIDLDESAMEMLANAKDRFRDARREATRAFNNESLKLPDRILAMKYRVMATILEALNNYANAFPACKVCIKELHALSEVRKNFKVEVEEGFMSRFGKGDRVEVIFSVCQINRVVYDVFGSRSIFDSWQYIETGEDGQDRIEPLKDNRVFNVLRKVNMGHCCLPWTISKNLKYPVGIITNTNGDFIVRDNSDHNVKIFNTRGEFLYCLDPSEFSDQGSRCRSLSLSVDLEDNIYVLVVEENKFIVVVFDKRGHFNKTLRLGNGSYRLLAVNDKGDIFICNESEIYVYGKDDNLNRFSRYLTDCDNITGIVAIGDCILVTVCPANCCFSGCCNGNLSWAHIFTAQGEHVKQIEFDDSQSYSLLAFHRESRHVLIAYEPYNTVCYNFGVPVSIYTQNGEFVRTILIQNPADVFSRFAPSAMTVTSGGNVAIADCSRRKVYVW